jgi:hypothetical protein
MTHRPVRMPALLAGIGLAMTLAGLLRLQASAGDPTWMDEKGRVAIW